MAKKIFLNYAPIVAAAFVLIISIANFYSVSIDNDQVEKRAQLLYQSKPQADNKVEDPAPKPIKNRTEEKSVNVNHVDVNDSATPKDIQIKASEAAVKKAGSKPVRVRLAKSKLRALKTKLSEAILVANYDPDQARAEMKVILKAVPKGHSFRSTVLSELRKN